jgi:hypothetical protein
MSHEFDVSLEWKSQDLWALRIECTSHDWDGKPLMMMRFYASDLEAAKVFATKAASAMVGQTVSLNFYTHWAAPKDETPYSDHFATFAITTETTD